MNHRGNADHRHDRRQHRTHHAQPQPREYQRGPRQKQRELHHDHRHDHPTQAAETDDNHAPEQQSRSPTQPPTVLFDVLEAVGHHHRFTGNHPRRQPPNDLSQFVNCLAPRRCLGIRFRQQQTNHGRNPPVGAVRVALKLLSNLGCNPVIRIHDLFDFQRLIEAQSGLNARHFVQLSPDFGQTTDSAAVSLQKTIVRIHGHYDLVTAEGPPQLQVGLHQRIVGSEHVLHRTIELDPARRPKRSGAQRQCRKKQPNPPGDENLDNRRRKRLHECLR